MENHHFSRKNPLFLWPFSMSLFVCLPGRVPPSAKFQVGLNLATSWPSLHRGGLEGKKLATARSSTMKKLQCRSRGIEKT